MAGGIEGKEDLGLTEERKKLIEDARDSAISELIQHHMDEFLDIFDKKKLELIKKERGL